jgi:hypothetical protein
LLLHWQWFQTSHQTPKRFLMISLASSWNWTTLLQELNYLFCTELYSRRSWQKLNYFFGNTMS